MDVIDLLNYSIAFFSLFTVFVFVLLLIRHRADMHRIPSRKGWTPVVSVIIPAYNEEDGIAQTLDSVLNLDYPKDKLDIMVVDDGSSDQTASIAKAFENDGVRLFSKPNGGKGAALNYGIARARGEFIATMDADSALMPDTLKELLPFFDSDDVMAVTPAIKAKEKSKLIVELQRIEYLMVLFSRKLLSFIDSVPVTPGPFSMFRAKVFKEIGGFDEKNLVEDHEICLRIQSANYKVRSSMSATVLTEVPDNFSDLLKQRIRWQRGGLRNYWRYRFLVNPKYGDFGMYFVPLNYLSITAFFLILGLMIHAVFSSPYYARYIIVDSVILGVGVVTIIGALVMLSTMLFVYLSVAAFKEKVSIKSFLLFLFFYWYLMLAYNVMTAVKEIRREPTSW